MKSAPFIPVNIFDEDAYIYTRTNHYMVEFLEESYNKLKNGEALDEDVIVPVAEIVAAYNYYLVARDNAFTFHPIFGNVSDFEIAFVSDSFDGIKVVIDATTLECYVIKPFWAQKVINSYVNKFVDDKDLYYLLKAYNGISMYPGNYLQGVVVNRDSPEEYLSIAPYLLPESCHNSVFEKEYYDSLMTTFTTMKESKYFYMDFLNTMIHSHDNCEHYDLNDVLRIMKIHDTVYDTKSDFIELFTTDSGDKPRFYISKDFKHIVDSNTFRNYLVTYNTLQTYLKCIARQQHITDNDISYIVEILEKLYDN